MKHPLSVQRCGRRVVARALVVAALTGLASHATAASLEPAAPRVAGAWARDHARTGIVLSFAGERALQQRGVVACIDPAAAQGAGRKTIKEVAACFAAGLALGATLATAAGGIVGVGVAAAAALIACL